MKKIIYRCNICMASSYDRDDILKHITNNHKPESMIMTEQAIIGNDNNDKIIEYNLLITYLRRSTLKTELHGNYNNSLSRSAAASAAHGVKLKHKQTLKTFAVDVIQNGTVNFYEIINDNCPVCYDHECTKRGV